MHRHGVSLRFLLRYCVRIFRLALLRCVALRREYGRHPARTIGQSLGFTRNVGLLELRQPVTCDGANSLAVLVSLILAMMTPWSDPHSKSQRGAARGEIGPSFRNHWHINNDINLLINMKYLAN